MSLNLELRILLSLVVWWKFQSMCSLRVQGADPTAHLLLGDGGETSFVEAFSFLAGPRVLAPFIFSSVVSPAPLQSGRSGMQGIFCSVLPPRWGAPLAAACSLPCLQCQMGPTVWA